MTSEQNTIKLTTWVDDKNGGIKPIEVVYSVKDKGDSYILTPLEKKDEKGGEES